MARLQLALNVSDLESSVEFYSTLFGVEPHKRRPGYANFAMAEPPLKLVLFQVSEEERGSGTAQALNHLGVEVDSSAEVEARAARLREAGLAAFDEKDTTCCYALQDKVWVHDPAGAPWEIYTVKDDHPVEGRAATTSLPLLRAEGQLGASSPLPLVATEAGLNDGGCCTQPSSGGSESAGPGRGEERVADADAAPRATACC